MKSLDKITRVIRSKNAGPFEITMDIIFRREKDYQAIKSGRMITRQKIASMYRLKPGDVSIFYCDPARAIKLSMPRACPSGAPEDTDIYGAQQHAPLLELEFPVS